MQVESITNVEINPAFLSAMTLDQVKEMRSNNGQGLRPRTIAAFIEPQADWFNGVTDRIPLGIPEWIDKHELFNTTLTSVVARVARHSRSQMARTTDESGQDQFELIATSDPLEVIYVHYITITNEYRNGRSLTKVDLHMGNGRRASIDNNFAQTFIDNELISSWSRIIRTNQETGESQYEWANVKRQDQPWKKYDNDVVVASLVERPKWPTFSSGTMAYRNIRRRIAPMYEYGLYVHGHKTAEELNLDSKVSLLGKKLDTLFDKYRQSYSSVPLHFGALYREMFNFGDLVKDPRDHVANSDLVARCIVMVGEEISREESKQEMRKRSRTTA